MSSSDDSGTPDAKAPTSEAKQRAAFALIAQVTLADHVDAHALRRVQLLGEDAVPALVEAAGFEERALRRFAVQALAAIGSRKGLASLLNVADEERGRNADLVAIALQGAAVVLRPTDAERVAPFAVEFLAHPSRFVRAAVADVLRVLEASGERDALLRLASDRDALVAERASLALAHLDLDTRASAAPADDVAPEGASTSTEQPLHPLVDRLASDDAVVRREAVAELSTLPGAGAMIARHLSSPHPHLRGAMLEAASTRRDPALFAPLRALIDAGRLDDHGRALALRGLTPDDGADLDALGRAVHALSHSNDLFVRAEAFACGIRAGVPHADELNDRGRRDPEEYVRERVAEAWGERPPKRSAAEPPGDASTRAPDVSPEVGPPETLITVRDA